MKRYEASDGQPSTQRELHGAIGGCYSKPSGSDMTAPALRVDGLGGEEVCEGGEEGRGGAGAEGEGVVGEAGVSAGRGGYADNPRQAMLEVLACGVRERDGKGLSVRSPRSRDGEELAGGADGGGDAAVCDIEVF